jgi:uncharacterized membrane protein
MVKRSIFSLLLFFLFFVPSTQAQEPETETVVQESYSNPQKEQFYRAKVLDIVREGQNDLGGIINTYQIVTVEFVNGDKKGEKITFEHGGNVSISESQLVKQGDEVVVVALPGVDETIYQIIDQYRLDNVWYLIGFFFIVVVSLSKWKGVGSIVGMFLSLLLITYFIVPFILKGYDPVIISIVGSAGILISTMYLAHGFSKKTTIAIGSILISLIITGILALLFVHVSKLTGLASDDAYALRFGSFDNLNFKGLLLGGIIIGALGVLDDIATSLTATVFEIRKANTKLSFSQLFESGMEVGKEHVSSLVNTLILAYAGASLPLFLLIVLNPNNYPMWMILNSETMIEEVVRTLAGSLGLIFAVPITAALASYLASIKTSK